MPREPKQKEPKRMGRPTFWPTSLGKNRTKSIGAPELFFTAWKDMEFRKKICDLTIDFLARK